MSDEQGKTERVRRKPTAEDDGKYLVPSPSGEQAGIAKYRKELKDISALAVKLVGNDKAGKELARVALYETILSGTPDNRIKAARAVLDSFKESSATNVQVNLGFNLAEVR